MPAHQLFEHRRPLILGSIPFFVNAAPRLLALLAVLMLVAPASAQVTPEEHAAHHPDEASSTDTPTPPGEGEGDSDTSGAPGGGMGSMMGEIGAPPLDLYPSLMSLQELSPEDIAAFEQQARQRVQAGMELMTEALDRIARASSEDDFEAMQEAAVLFREGFARFESGLATSQFLSEGQPPQEIALNWFRREMNIAPESGVPGRGPLGFTWFHFITMIVLLVFGTAMIWLYFVKMRRASVLIARLAGVSAKRSSDA